MNTIRKIEMKRIGLAVVMGILMIALFIPLLHAAGLNDTEKSYLLLMREEEKLARDVYQALNAKWSHRRSATYRRASSNIWTLSKYCSTNTASTIRQPEKAR